MKREKNFSVVKFQYINPIQIVLRVPSTDPKTCVECIAFFLKWLDSKV